jgi:hypothetical protein
VYVVSHIALPLEFEIVDRIVKAPAVVPEFTHTVWRFVTEQNVAPDVLLIRAQL